MRKFRSMLGAGHAGGRRRAGVLPGGARDRRRRSRRGAGHSRRPSPRPRRGIDGGRQRSEHAPDPAVVPRRHDRCRQFAHVRSERDACTSSSGICSPASRGPGRGPLDPIASAPDTAGPDAIFHWAGDFPRDCPRDCPRSRRQEPAVPRAGSLPLTGKAAALTPSGRLAPSRTNSRQRVDVWHPGAGVLPGHFHVAASFLGSTSGRRRRAANRRIGGSRGGPAHRVCFRA